MLVTTLNNIKEHDPCGGGWKTLLKNLGKTKADDEELSFLTILESNGFDDALWCARSAPEYSKEWRLFAVWCARQVQHLITDERSISALDIADKYTNGEATKDELNAAMAAACAAASAAESASESASAMAAARSAARGVAMAAAWDSAMAAARSAARGVAMASAWDSAMAAAMAAARDAQKEQFIKVIIGE